MPSGKGTLTFYDGRKFVGEWKFEMVVSKIGAPVPRKNDARHHAQLCHLWSGYDVLSRREKRSRRIQERQVPEEIETYATV